MGRRFVLSSGVVVEVCALNSSSLETGKNFLAGMGRIQEPAFVQVAKELGWTNNGKTLSLRLLALHHHLALTDDLEDHGEYYKGFGIAIDAPRIQRLAAQYGVHLAVHGHKHRAFVWRSAVYELPERSQQKWQLGELSIVGGGSAGSSSTDGKQNFFNLLTANPAGLTLEIFRATANSGTFHPMQTWRGKFSICDEALALGPWELIQIKE